MGKIFDIEVSKLEEIKAYITAKEIDQQPRLWEETYVILEKNKKGLNDFLDRIGRDHLKVIFTGAGTSEFVGNTIVPFLKEQGIWVESIATTDIVSNPQVYLKKKSKTLLISCARSGNSPESVATVELAEQLVDNLYQIFLTCNPDGKLAKKSENNEKNYLLLMPKDSNDKGFAMTGSFTCMSLAGLMLFNLEKLDSFKNYVNEIKEKGQESMSLFLEKIKEIANLDHDRIVFLGSSCLKGLSQEASLKTLELSGGKIVTDYNSPLGFRHGPKSIVNEKTVTFIMLSQDEYTRKYDKDLLKEMSLERKGNQIVVFDNFYDEEVEKLSDFYINIDLEVCHDVFLMFNYIILAQKYAFYKSLYLDITPDNPCPTGEVNRVVQGVIIHKYEGDKKC